MTRLRVLVLLVAASAAFGCAATRTLTRAEAEEALAPAKVTYVPVDIGGTAPLYVRVADEGKQDGPVLVLLHGLFSSAESWDGWVAQLKDRYRIIRLDLPGSGLTGARPDRNYSVTADAAVVRAVLESRGVTGDFSLAGNSLGGYVAWVLAADPALSSHVKNLILVSPIGLRAKPGRADRVPAPLRAIFRFITPRFMVQRAHPVEKAKVDAYWALARFDGNRSAVDDRLSQPWIDHSALLDLISARTLVLWGADDHYLVEPDDACCFWHRIPRAQIAVLPGVKHMGMEENPVLTAGIAADFLAGNDTPALPAGARRDCARLKPTPRIALGGGHAHEDAAFTLPAPEPMAGFDEVYVFGEKDRPAILLLHEAPGLTRNTFRLADDIAKKGYSVYVPLLFGTAGERSNWNFVRLLIDPRFLAWRNSPPPIVKRLKALALDIASESPHGKIGVIGMCLTGGLPVSLQRRLPNVVTAAVVSQPALPFFRPRALGLDDDDSTYLKEKHDHSVLFLRFSHDKISPWEREAAYECDFPDAIDFHIVDSSPCNRNGVPVTAHPVLTSLYDQHGAMVPSRRNDFEALMAYLKKRLSPDSK